VALRFSRRLSIIPGLRLNLGAHGASVSIGHRGLWYTIGPRGRRVTLGIPGTGVYWTEKITAANEPHGGHRLSTVLFVFALVGAIAVIADALMPGAPRSEVDASATDRASPIMEQSDAPTTVAPIAPYSHAKAHERRRKIAAAKKAGRPLQLHGDSPASAQIP